MVSFAPGDFSETKKSVSVKTDIQIRQVKDEEVLEETTKVATEHLSERDASLIVSVPSEKRQKSMELVTVPRTVAEILAEKRASGASGPSLMNMIRANNGKKLTMEAKRRIEERRNKKKRLETIASAATENDQDDQTDDETEGNADPVAALAVPIEDGAADQSLPASMRPKLTIVDGKIVMAEKVAVHADHVRTAGDMALEQRQNEMGFGPPGNVVRVTSTSFKKNLKNYRWSVAETRKFYELLGELGTDFGAIARKLGPHRVRKHVRHKYIREAKKKPRLIERILHNKK